MAKTRFVTRASPYKEWVKLVGQIDRINEKATRDATQDTAPDALRMLRHTPGKPDYPIQWTSEKQRKAFFATNGFGRGIPTKRSGKLQDGWRIVAVRRRRSTVVLIENPVGYVEYVQGGVNFKSAAEALVMRQRFHKNTGWRAAQPIVADFYKRHRTAYQKSFRELLGDGFAKPFERRRYD